MYSCVLDVVECAMKIFYCVMEDVFVTMYSDPYIISIARYASPYRLLFEFAFVHLFVLNFRSLFIRSLCHCVH